MVESGEPKADARIQQLMYWHTLASLSVLAPPNPILASPLAAPLGRKKCEANIGYEKFPLDSLNFIF
jgi:hypothetical protein